MEVVDFKALLSSQIAALDSSQISALSLSQIRAFTTAQIIAIETADIAGFSTQQLKALSVTNFVQLTSDQIVALSPDQIEGLTVSQISALDSAKLAQWSTDQLGALTTSQHAALTEVQLNAMTTDQLAAASTPLILDLGNDGIHTTSIDRGVTFDLLNTGTRVPTGWVGANDGLLVRDLNANGSIDSGAELFGSSTVLPDGSIASDGFQALSALDSDGNGVIDGFDRAFGELLVWQDSDQDGVSQEGELFSLDELSIKSISLGFTPVSQDDAGNWIGLESSYQTTDEETHKLVDVWFKLS